MVLGVAEFTTHLPSQGRSSEFYHAIADNVGTPLLRKFLDPEGELLGSSVALLLDLLCISYHLPILFFQSLIMRPWN